MKAFIVIAIALGLFWITPAWTKGSRKSGKNMKPDKTDQSQKSDSDHVAGELLVAFESTTTKDQRSNIFKKLGLKEKSKVGSTELYLVEVPASKSLDEMIESLKAFPEIRFSEKNLTMRTFKPMNPNQATE